MRIVIFLIVAVALFATVVIVNAWRAPSYQIDVKPEHGPAVDRDAAVGRLAGAIRFQTISSEDPGQFNAQAFLGLHAYLEQAFPLVHATLQKEIVNEYGLLYRWPGTSPDLKPILLMGHMDVVPIEPGTEYEWTHPPFDARTADGYLWGRGTMDMKQAVMAYLEAVETLLASGFKPTRTVYLALHHDEEIGGRNGALQIAELLGERGVRLEFTLDEGSAITNGIIPGVESPVALIALAEKGYLTLNLTARGKGGHSSRPPRPTAIGRLARAIDRLETSQMPADLRAPASGIFEHLASEMPFHLRAVIANRWLFEPLLLKRLASRPATNAIIRTTTAPTIIEGGIKENLLPTEVNAVVNFRLLPGDTIEQVIAHVRETIDDPEIEIHQRDHAREASPISNIDSDSYKALNKTIRQVSPDVVVAPSLVIGGTDSKHYVKITDNSYRIIPMRIVGEDLQRMHGIDERIEISNYEEIIRFYIQLIRNVAGLRVPNTHAAIGR